ncbi:hypothetical protein E4T43_07331 [Aureobasidium subglaciale]|nr:hypothetical protein E4T43_07331 [Aureobasidium subglaciale]
MHIPISNVQGSQLLQVREPFWRAHDALVASRLESEATGIVELIAANQPSERDAPLFLRLVEEERANNGSNEASVLEERPIPAAPYPHPLLVLRTHAKTKPSTPATSLSRPVNRKENERLPIAPRGISTARLGELSTPTVSHPNSGAFSIRSGNVNAAAPSPRLPSTPSFTIRPATPAARPLTPRRRKTKASNSPKDREVSGGERRGTRSQTADRRVQCMEKAVIERERVERQRYTEGEVVKGMAVLDISHAERRHIERDPGSDQQSGADTGRKDHALQLTSDTDKFDWMMLD